MAYYLALTLLFPPFALAGFAALPLTRFKYEGAYLLLGFFITITYFRCSVVSNICLPLASSCSRTSTRDL